MKRILYVITVGLLFVFTQCTVDSNKENSNKKHLSKKEMMLANAPISQRKAYVKGKLKNDSPNKFAEYFKQIKTKIGEEEPDYPDNYKFLELEKAIKSLPKGKTAENLNWVSRGPGNIGGRSRGMIIDPDDASGDTWYVAAVGGGVWKTTDAGQNWTELTVGIGSLSASYMAMAASNHDVIYLGTGEGFGNLDALGGQGLWKTTDRGQTWSQLTNTATSTIGVINRVIVDPNNEEIVVIASNTGIHKSSNGGSSFGKKYSVTSGQKIYQVISNPNDFNIQYAATSDGKVLKSINGGDTWTDSSNGILNLNRIEMAISEKDPNYLYVSGDPISGYSRVYKSTNAGQTWMALSITPIKDILGGQGWYDNCITVSPYDRDEIYIGGVNLYKLNTSSTTATLSVITSHYESPYITKGTHVDYHYMTTMKLNESAQTFRMLVSNDGGVCYTDDKGATFEQPISGFVTSQFYGVDKANGEDKYIGGMQDNSSFISPNNPNSSSSWTKIIGGDGFDAVINYDDAGKYIVTSQYNWIYVNHNGSEYYPNLYRSDDDNAPFFTKIAQSKQSPNFLVTRSKNDIWISKDFGINWENTAMPNDFYGHYSLNEVKISLVNPSIIWTGVSALTNYPLYLSTDYGKTFNKVSSIPSVFTFLSGFATHPVDKNTAYALFSGSGVGKIFKTSDLGQTWTDITQFVGGKSQNGFPDVVVYDLLVMPYDTNIIWAGTEIGIFESKDGGYTWNYSNFGLPPVSVFDMRIVNNEVVVGTHGRGIWSVELPELANYEPPGASIEGEYKFDGSKQLAEVTISSRSDYDSIKVYINDNLYEKLDAGIAGDTFDRSIEIVGGENIIKAVVHINGNAFENQFSINGINLVAASDGYQNTFNNMTDLSQDFTGNGFYISTPTGFGDNCLGTSHPYDQQVELILYLNTPIIVDEGHPDISFKDIALIEPGEPGVVYPSENFWDYVTVEASNDGKTWLQLLTPYDASYNTLWTNLYNSITDPSKLHYVEHTCKTTDFFNNGEVILIRFRLYSDQEVTGWGWAIDDLLIQNEQLAIDNFGLQSSEISVYPNPININTKINLSSDFTGRQANYSVFDLNGKVVLQGKFKALENTITLPFNSDKLSPGNYIMFISNDMYGARVKIVK